MRSTLEQLLSLFRTMSASQKLTLGVVTLAIPAALFLLIFNGSTSSYVPLSYGKLFTADEQRGAEQALKEAGLTHFRSEGRQILAPRSEVEKYNNALLQSGSLPANWAEELEKKLDKSTLFSTPEQMQAIKDTALAKELIRIIKAGPDFDDVSVLWTKSDPRRPRGSRNSRVTATISVKPKNGRELTQQQVRSLRAAVAGMVPDLSPSDVTVYDMLNYQSFEGSKEGDTFDNSLITWIREHTRTYEDKIRNSLAFIPGVKVSVTVDVENLKRSIETSVKYDQKNSIPRYQSDVTRTESYSQAPVKAEPGQVSNQPLNLQTSATNQKSRETNDTQSTILNAPASTTVMKEYIPAFPSKVSVAVAIPEDYYQKAIEKSSADGQPAKKLDQVQAEVAATVKQLAASAIPNGNPEQISVTSFVQVDPVIPKVEISPLDTITSLGNQWGGTIGLSLFALWALWMLRKSMPKGAQEEPPMPAALASGNAPTIAPSTTATINVGALEEDNSPREPSERDMLQGMVRDNPEVAAAVLSKWLQAAK